MNKCDFAYAAELTSGQKGNVVRSAGNYANLWSGEQWGSIWNTKAMKAWKPLFGHFLLNAPFKTWPPGVKFIVHCPDLQTPHMTGAVWLWKSWLATGPSPLALWLFITWTVYACGPQWARYEPMLIQHLQFASFLFPGWDFCETHPSFVHDRWACHRPQLLPDPPWVSQCLSPSRSLLSPAAATMGLADTRTNTTVFC